MDGPASACRSACRAAPDVRPGGGPLRSGCGNAPVHARVPGRLPASPRAWAPSRVSPRLGARCPCRLHGRPWTDRRRRAAALPCHSGCAAGRRVPSVPCVITGCAPASLGAFPRLPASGRTGPPTSARWAPCPPVGTGACPAARVKPRLREWKCPLWLHSSRVPRRLPVPRSVVAPPCARPRPGVRGGVPDRRARAPPAVFHTDAGHPANSHNPRLSEVATGRIRPGV